MRRETAREVIGTAFGHRVTHESGRVRLAATQTQLQYWASKPGAEWPCSQLATLQGGWADFDEDGSLVNMCTAWSDANIFAGEFNAWAEDVVEAAEARKERDG